LATGRLDFLIDGADWDRTDDLSFYKKIPLFPEGSNRMERFYSEFISNINFLSSQSYPGRG